MCKKTWFIRVAWQKQTFKRDLNVVSLIQIQISPGYFIVIEIRLWCHQQKLQTIFWIPLFHPYICWQSFSNTFWNLGWLLPWIAPGCSCWQGCTAGQVMSKVKAKRVVPGLCLWDTGQSPVREQSDLKVNKVIKGVSNTQEKRKSDTIENKYTVWRKRGVTVLF